MNTRCLRSRLQPALHASSLPAHVRTPPTSCRHTCLTHTRTCPLPPPPPRRQPGAAAARAVRHPRRVHPAGLKPQWPPLPHRQPGRRRDGLGATQGEPHRLSPQAQQLASSHACMACIVQAPCSAPGRAAWARAVHVEVRSSSSTCAVATSQHMRASDCHVLMLPWQHDAWHHACALHLMIVMARLPAPQPPCLMVLP
jgi:hypothetical protein